MIDDPMIILTYHRTRDIRAVRDVAEIQDAYVRQGYQAMQISDNVCPREIHMSECLHGLKSRDVADNARVL